MSIPLFLIVVAAAQVGVIGAVVAGIVGLLGLTVVNGVCALVTAVIGADNDNLRTVHEVRKRAEPSATLFRF